MFLNFFYLSQKEKITNSQHSSFTDFCKLEKCRSLVMSVNVMFESGNLIEILQMYHNM